jgi:hypothetical protein
MRTDPTAAQALVAGLMLGKGERYGDTALTSAGEWLAIRSLVASAAAIGFTGTRRGMTVAQRKTLRSLLLTGSGKLHHGDAIGADAEAHDIAIALGRRRCDPSRITARSARVQISRRHPLTQGAVGAQQRHSTRDERLDFGPRGADRTIPFRHVGDHSPCAQAQASDRNHLP